MSSAVGPEDILSPSVNSPGSPMPTGTPGGGAGGSKLSTTRKCANCGMVGHIRTNKKLCPKLNPALNGGASSTVGSPGPSEGVVGGMMSPPGSFSA